jgi:hypothetical protein
MKLKRYESFWPGPNRTTGALRYYYVCHISRRLEVLIGESGGDSQKLGETRYWMNFTDVSIVGVATMLPAIRECIRELRDEVA